MDVEWPQNVDVYPRFCKEKKEKKEKICDMETYIRPLLLVITFESPVVYCDTCLDNLPPGSTTVCGRGGGRGGGG